VREQAGLLDHVAHLAAQLGGVAIPHRGVADQDVALGDLDRAVDHPHRSCLPATGRPDQDADLAGWNLEREVVDRWRGLARITLGHVPI
jgi:hypothetical protein